MKYIICQTKINAMKKNKQSKLEVWRSASILCDGRTY